MARLQFVDAKGIEWTVYDVLGHTESSTRRSAAQALERIDAWLLFESTAGRRLFSPLPLAWDESSVDDLRLLLDFATPLSIAVKRPE